MAMEGDSIHYKAGVGLPLRGTAWKQGLRAVLTMFSERKTD